MTFHIEAKALTRESIYDRKVYEICEGSENLLLSECRELMQRWKQDDKTDHNYFTTDYRIMPDLGR